MNTFSDAAHPSDADEPHAIIAALQQHDQLLAQGTLLYRHHSWESPNNWEAPTEFDPEAMDETNETHETNAREQPEPGEGEEDFERESLLRDILAPRDSVMDCELVYTKEGHMWRQVTEVDPQTGEPLPLIDPATGEPLERAPTSSFTTIYDGQDYRIIMGDQVTLAPGRPDDLEEDSRPITLYPGPCFMMGRGLSRLHDIEIERVNGQLHLTGSVGDGTRAEAELDALHGYLATRIVRKDENGSVMGTTVLDTPILMGESYIASHAVYSVTDEGQTEPSFREEYSIHSAADQPRAVDFSPLLPKGSLVLDCRLDHPVDWDMETDQTPAQLLPQTQQSLQEQAAIKAQSEERWKRLQAGQEGGDDSPSDNP